MKLVKLVLFCAIAYLNFQPLAHAERTEKPSNKKRYFSVSGEKMTSREAYKNDGTFLECKEVEVVTNEDTGKPSIKPVK